MKIQVVKWSELDNAFEKISKLRRPVQTTHQELKIGVEKIIDEVKKKGDRAVRRLTKEYDRIDLDSFKVTEAEIETAYEKLQTNTVSALKEAIRRVGIFHQAQYPKAIDLETSPGVRCERRFIPISSVGLYVPAGTAPLPSTVIMLGVPSGIAKCRKRILVTPPSRDGSIDPSILVAADLVGIREVYKVGGAQAIAAMAYGTETIPKVDKVFGPGNSWVTEAKLQVSQDPEGATCDLPAGPSEVLVIADETAEPDFVAADLLSQAEHGADSQVILVSNSSRLIERVLTELEYQLKRLPRRQTATEALSKSCAIEVSKIEEAVEICNLYAPEHLIIQTREPRVLAESVENAGSVFLGPWTPESMGDYASGTNHVLPTYGFARTSGGVTTESFMKTMTVQELSLEGLDTLGPVVEELASIEQLEGHRQAVRVRLGKEVL